MGMATKQAQATQTEMQPASSIEQPPTESRRGRKHSKETKAKMSEAHKGKKHSEETRTKLSEANLGENNPMYGKQRSEETRAKMSEAMSGENHPMYGKQHSEETRAKMSEALSGENHPMYGKQHSEEARAKMSEANLGENNPMYGKQHSEEARTKLSEANLGENNPHWDKNIEQVRQAIALHASGMSMRQASQCVNFSVNWLSCWKCKHPERFQAFYFEGIEKNDQKMIRWAVGAYALGASMEEASRHVGMPEEWFRGWQDENLEKFEIWLKHINDKETRLVRQIFRLCSDEDMSIEEAVSELGLESDWLKNWREDHPVRYGQIKEEEKLIFGDRLDNLLARYERKM